MDELGKFKRQPPEDRRQALIEATLACLGREGHAGLSVRKISAEAGISIGLIVDSVSEVMVLQDEDIAPPPDVSHGGPKYIKGIGKAGGNVRLLLDCQKLLTDDEFETLGAMA